MCFLLFLLYQKKIIELVFGNLKTKINQKIYDDNSMYHYVFFFVLCSNILDVTHDCSDGSRQANVLFYSGICFCQSHS